MRIGVIDIGTNTVLLLIADVDAHGKIDAVYHGHEIARMGEGVDEHRVIRPEAIKRVEAIVNRFLEMAKHHKTDVVTVCGTSALRDSSNRDEIVARLQEASGINLRILTGEEEAELTYLGAIGEFQREGKKNAFAVLDIGGGSTEITVGAGTTLQSKQSIDLGCVRLTERFLKNSPPSSLDINNALQFIRREIASLAPLEDDVQLIGVAGTLTTLGSIDLRRPAYDPARVSGHRLTREVIRAIFNRLRIKSVEEMKQVPQVLPGRADILLAGILILLEIMNQLEISEITVSDRGLRYGVALREGSR